MSEPRYSIGIDLGTTHCALSYVDLAASDGERTRLDVLPIAQLTAPGAIESPNLLPSFLYLPHPSELAPGELALPWAAERDFAVGELARSRGAGTPIRLVSSAKSWLCHPGVDRRAGILPSDAPPEVARVSPLESSVRYLTHLRDAWNHAHPDAPFDQQDVTVTIPASFDPAARELTAEAAQAAGYARMTLLEEPQAALYSWIEKSGGAWRKEVKVGDIILVVDVGGGTTDLSLIAVVERDGNLELHRVAVGEHILLGGDNMDLALAHVVARKLAAQGTQADPWQLRALTYACRGAKETLLGDPSAQAVPLVVPSRGSKLIGGSIRTELTRAELTQTILEGFFPQVDASARPVSRTRAGLTQLGLPYAQDAGVTRHLAAFLGRQVAALAELGGLQHAHDASASFLHPTAVLFNGGVFKSPLLVERLLDTLNGWLAAEGAAPARLLGGADLDLAVARGAAYYGYVKRGRGVRIRGGTARAYYIAVESAMPAVPGLEPPIQALCVAPFGMEEGTDAALPPQEFGLVVGEPVHFRFFGSSVRRQDQVGTLLDFWSPDELQELDAIEATLPTEGRTSGEIVPVKLHARVTEAGTLELEAVQGGTNERWKVEFDVRGGANA
ncbi:hsp70 family protein [Burkholderia thailandensis USAMRU Malaysia |uniref:DnaK-related protein (Molecular chaperone) n=1 Tax=Burkholderia thailandensis (strain ATCC 700388 / DSM 13276 / CCUG 48851 / CIP 106301 / E264) TaxID=271848 RepID=Q2T5N3_BURTA|nr:Hsp70 family protein [Burkholderia thailandensis]ABC35625.1 putative DnaK-related protein (Molecular chaperone) [Burkholderia thailandensis E264]AHI76648.1 hsp70 family protein [Burkholderia thailandensis 2002721723]AHI81181.1 hsp70 family protein [Burkholderia thailandensis E444]AIC89740.1 hsp70 family protein [Burkholderia thailandensis USAMRU Malaysia \